MKKFILLFFLIPAFALAQNVRTEVVSNKYKYYSSATTGDTLFKHDTTSSGSSVPFIGVTGEIVGITIGKPLSKDTIILMNGKGTVWSTILDSTYTSYPSTRITVPEFVSIPTRLDTSLIVKTAKGSWFTVFFRIIR